MKVSSFPTKAILRLLSTSVAALLISSTTAMAESKQETLASCFAAIEGGQTEAFEVIAAEIQSWQWIFDTEIRTKGAECLSRGFGDDWEYSISSGKFIGPDTIAIEQAEREASIQEANKREGLRTERECIFKRLQLTSELLQSLQNDISADLNREVDNAVRLACEAEFLTSPNATVLNPVCNQVFRNSGLPDSQYLSSPTGQPKAERIQSISEIYNTLALYWASLGVMLGDLEIETQIQQELPFLNNPLEGCSPL